MKKKNNACGLMTKKTLTMYNYKTIFISIYKVN